MFGSSFAAGTEPFPRSAVYMAIDKLPEISVSLPAAGRVLEQGRTDRGGAVFELFVGLREIRHHNGEETARDSGAYAVDAVLEHQTDFRFWPRASAAFKKSSGSGLAWVTLSPVITASKQERRPVRSRFVRVYVSVLAVATALGMRCPDSQESSSLRPGLTGRSRSFKRTA